MQSSCNRFFVTLWAPEHDADCHSGNNDFKSLLRAARAAGPRAVPRCIADVTVCFSSARQSATDRELPFWSDAFDRVFSERGGKRTSEWQDEWKGLVTICFSQRTDRLQTFLCIVSSARCQSGHAEDCKSLYVGAIPARASNLNCAVNVSGLFRSMSLGGGAKQKYAAWKGMIYL